MQLSSCTKNNKGKTNVTISLDLWNPKKSMPKTEECDRCQMFSGSCDPEHLVCGIHPSGPTEVPCPDFAQVTEDCMPLGAAYYGDELVLQPEHYLSTEERLEILNTHPLFTGVCPN
jgi:hypothetical protein